MDPDSPVSRAGRTFWTFWNYLTETVSRFFRPEHPIIERNDHIIIQDASVSNEKIDSGHTDRSEEGETEKNVAPASYNLSRPVVFWDTGSEFETETVVKMCEEGGSMREEEADETGIDVANLSIADHPTDYTQEESSNLKIDVEVANIWSLPNEDLSVEIVEQNSNGVEGPDETAALDAADQLTEKDKLEAKTFQKEQNEIYEKSQTIDTAVIENNQDLEESPSSDFPQTLPHAELTMSDDSCRTVPESGQTVDIQEHLMANRSNDSVNGESEKVKIKNSEKDIDSNEQGASVSDGQECEMAQESEEDITCNASAGAEDRGQENAAHLGFVTQTVDLDAEETFNITDDKDNFTKLSNEKEGCMEMFTVKPEPQYEQEDVNVFENMAKAKFEDQHYVSQEQYSSHKESREGVPEHNNETGSNGSATQRFLEEGNYREVQTTLLQEEVESEEEKGLQNSSSEAGADYYEETELMETEYKESSFEVENDGSLTERTIEQENAIKTIVKDKEFEADDVSQDEAGSLKEETKEILVEMGETIYEAEIAAEDGSKIQTENVAGFSEDTFYEMEFQKMNETVFLDGSTDEYVLCETLAQKESKVECQVEMQNREINLKDIDLCTAKEEQKDEIVFENNCEKSEVHLGLPVEDDKTVSSEGKLIDIGDHGISATMLLQSPVNVGQTYMFDQLVCSEVIEDEILDLWIEQTSMEHADVKEEDQEEQEKLSELPKEEGAESSPVLSIVCDVSSFTAESGFFDHSLDIDGLHHDKIHDYDPPKKEELTDCTSKSEDVNTFSESELGIFYKENTTEEAQTQPHTEAEEPMSRTVIKEDNYHADDGPLKKMQAHSEMEAVTQFDSSVETENTVVMCDISPEICQMPLQEKPEEEVLLWFKTTNKDEVVGELDFSPQKSRIALKNPQVRPPKDPRSLLHKPSLDLSPLKQHPSQVPASVPLRGVGIGVKLPGLDAGFPVIRKTKKTVEEETETTTKVPEVNNDKLEQEDSHNKPKWLPPQQPGFGNPLMSELKSKLKKTSKE